MSKNYLVELGRERAIAMAELERLFGSDNLSPLGNFAIVKDAEPARFKLLGGSPKVAELLDEVEDFDSRDLNILVAKYCKQLSEHAGKKLNIGVSIYGLNIPLKVLRADTFSAVKALRKDGIKARAVPNKESTLNSAQVWHNRLDVAPNIELLLISENKRLYIGRTVYVQDIDGFSRRDRQKPVRDMKIGMLPPKLARTMINLAGPAHGETVLDAFCGTGTVLIEAIDMGYKAMGTDLNPQMVEATKTNLNWFTNDNQENVVLVEKADAKTHNWQPLPDVIVSESYLGPPLNSLPVPRHLDQIVAEVDEIVRSSLNNIASQVKSGTVVVMGVPAWYDSKNRRYKHLPVVDDISSLEYNLLDLKHVQSRDILYHRPDQVVARQLLIIIRK